MTNIQLNLFRVAFFALILCGFNIKNAFAEGEELAAQGRELAQQWCSKCHDVEAGGPFKQFPPSFAAIAAYRPPEQIYGRIISPPVHSSMPQVAYILLSDNIEALTAYIQSLDTQ